MRITGLADVIFRAIRLVVWLVVATLFAVFFLFPPFGPMSDGFRNLAGADARNRLREEWPPNIEPSDVLRVSMQHNSSIDASTRWYQIELTPSAAALWQEFVHAREAERIMSAGHPGEAVEGVVRDLDSLPEFRLQQGSTPSWWKPPQGTVHATEGVKWYKSQSGVGYGLYSQFDETTGTLWICDYSAQHGYLWEKGAVPEGRRFNAESPSPASFARVRLGDRWPSAVRVEEVSSCQFDEGSVRFDSDSPHRTTTFWLKARLTPEAAKAWADEVHHREVKRIQSMIANGLAVEGVQRELNREMPKRREVGGRPNWWTPPAGPIRATEAIEWNQPAIGSSLFTLFDESTGTLWMYLNSSPKDVFWAQGSPAAGAPILVDWPSL